MMRRWDEEVDAATAKAVGDYPDEEFDELLMDLPYLDLEEGLKKVHSELDAIYDLTKTYDDTLLEGGSVVFPSSTSPDGVVIFRLVEHLRVHYTNKSLGWPGRVLLRCVPDSWGCLRSIGRTGSRS